MGEKRVLLESVLLGLQTSAYQIIGLERLASILAGREYGSWVDQTRGVAHV